MRGNVASNLEAVVPLVLRDPSGRHMQVEAVIDTGFTEYLTLPPRIVEHLGLPLCETNIVMLADGTTKPLELHECLVLWHGSELALLAHCIECSPLIGMALLAGSLPTTEVKPGGAVTIAPPPVTPPLTATVLPPSPSRTPPLSRCTRS